MRERKHPNSTRRANVLSATRRGGLRTGLGLLILLSGCGMADFAYDLAPRIAVRYADDYLQLDNAQEANALALFRERHALHARDELPRYYRFLEETRAVTLDGVTREEVDAIFDGVTAMFELGVGRTIPAVATILSGLDRDQLDALEERLKESADEYREELDDDHMGRRVGETIEDVEEWLGSINDAQREMLTRELRAMTETGPMWLQWRIQRNARLVALLRADPSRAAIETFLEGYWLRRDGLPQELAAGTDANRSRYRDMIASLDESLSAEQRRHVAMKLAEYRDQVIDMMPDEIRIATLAGNAVHQGQQ